MLQAPEKSLWQAPKNYLQVTAPISEVQEWKHFLPVLGGTVTSEC